MPNSNMRIIADNAADRAALASSSQSGTLGAGNLQNDFKTSVWRTTQAAASLTLTWPSYEAISAAIFAFTNFTNAAQMRCRGYREVTDSTPTLDTGWVNACPVPDVGEFDWGGLLGDNFYGSAGASSFMYGLGAYGRLWFDSGYACKRLLIDIQDAGNTSGYLEMGRLIVGRHWEPKYNFDYNFSLEFMDASKNQRSEAGDLRTELGARWRKVSLSVGLLETDDQAAALRILRQNGVSKPLFISMFPEHDDPVLEQAYQVWGKMGSGLRMTSPRYALYQQPFEIEEM